MAYPKEYTREQINIGVKNHKLAIKHFEEIGALPKDRKPYEYVLHHKDETLRHNDPDRYIQWNFEDLEVKLNTKHAGEHTKGRPSPNKGKTLDAEAKRKISEKLKGRPRTPESIEKQKKAQIGRIWSEESKAKLSHSKMGHTFSEESKKKISETLKKYYANKKEIA